jgi:hypothetical protein
MVADFRGLFNCYDYSDEISRVAFDDMRQNPAFGSPSVAHRETLAGNGYSPPPWRNTLEDDPTQACLHDCSVARRVDPADRVF